MMELQPQKEICHLLLLLLDVYSWCQQLIHQLRSYHNGSILIGMLMVRCAWCRLPSTRLCSHRFPGLAPGVRDTVLQMFPYHESEDIQAEKPTWPHWFYWLQPIPLIWFWEHRTIWPIRWSVVHQQVLKTCLQLRTLVSTCVLITSRPVWGQAHHKGIRPVSVSLTPLGPFRFLLSHPEPVAAAFCHL